MNYCNLCGKPISLKIPAGDNRERHVCDHCDTIHYQNPRVIAGCIPAFEDQVLLCKRAIEPRHGLWTLPAGFLENGETTLEGANRECMEEACAQIIDAQLSCIYDIPHINQVYIFYRGPLHNMDFAPGEESLEVGLFREHEVPWGELAFPVVERALHYYFEDLKRARFEVRTGSIEKPWTWLRS
jgi:ADP-ribose pyrophosphatase YjhB (NUDIX family)